MPSLNTSTIMTRAKSGKKDEFYTQYCDIGKEIQAYLEFDRDIFKSDILPAINGGAS